MASVDLNDLTIQDVMEDPRRFGMPTFEEFRKDPEKWKGRSDELLVSAEGSTTVKSLRDSIEKQTYSCLGYDCGTSLEKVERIATEEGYKVSDLEMAPEIRPDVGGKVRIHVAFRAKKPKEVIA